MNSATLRRLAGDHAALHREVLPPYYLHQRDAAMSDDLTQLTILLAGPCGTPYENGLWKLHLRIPVDYPKSPPKASFRTKIFHPNVEEVTGAVCLDTLKRDWSPQLTLRDILITISCLLINPNPDSALNSSAGKLLQEDFDGFARKARLMTSIHAAVPKDMRLEVSEAVTRGEDIPEDESEYGDENSESKENDPSISPSPVSPSKPRQRDSILGKRPLSDLPIPVEPIDDAKTVESLANIAANTPNLSSNMSSLSFTGTPTSSQPQRRIAQPHGADRIAPSPRVFTFTGIATNSNPEPVLQPTSAKRLRTIDGKENENDERDLDAERFGKKVMLQSSVARPMAPLGLGLKLGSVPATAMKAKSKARIGLRRL